MPLVTMIYAWVVPVATFGADFRWKVNTHPTVRGNVSNSTRQKCTFIDKAIYIALKVALPVWKTTSNAILHREGGIPSAQVILEGNLLRLSASINSLND